MGNNMTLKSAKGDVNAYLTRPEKTARGAVIVVHEVWALNDHTKDIADRFAREGYIALAPDLLSDTLDIKKVSPLQVDYFNPEKRNEVQPKLRELMTPMHNPSFGEDTLTKLDACFEHLYTMKEADQCVAIVGYCFGGTYTYGLAVREPRLKLALPFYGHANFNVDELRMITCPVRAFYGENDENLISSLPELKNKMKEAGVDYEATVYPSCGHAFFNDTNKFAYNEKAATDAWKRTLDYLQQFVAAH
jgi:carboxymethylenebutenolidase